jgi:hypothetical protein
MAKEPPKPRPEVVRLGIVSGVIAALCCFTPIRVVVLNAIRLGWVAGYLDVVLLPSTGRISWPHSLCALAK